MGAAGTGGIGPGDPSIELHVLPGLTLQDELPEVLPAEENEVALPAVGARVRCERLTGAVELNGCLGRVVHHVERHARVLIDCPGGRIVRVKPKNLVVVIDGLRLLQVPGFFEREVLARLRPTDRAMLAKVDRRCRAAVLAFGLPGAGVERGLRLNLPDFCHSVEMLAWAG